MRQPRFAPAVPTEVMPGQPRSGTAGAVETFSLWAPSQLRERLPPGTVTTRARIPQRRRHRSATVPLRRQTRPGRARVLPPHPGPRQPLVDRRGIGGGVGPEQPAKPLNAADDTTVPLMTARAIRRSGRSKGGGVGGQPPPVTGSYERWASRSRAGSAALARTAWRVRRMRPSQLDSVCRCRSGRFAVLHGREKAAGRWPGYASRRFKTQNVTASRMAARITKMPVSMPWNAQNLLAGW